MTELQKTEQKEDSRAEEKEERGNNRKEKGKHINVLHLKHFYYSIIIWPLVSLG
jgi:hypothetical protein